MNENREATRTIEAAIEEHRSRYDAGCEPINPQCFNGLTVGDLMTALDGRRVKLAPGKSFGDALASIIGGLGVQREAGVNS